MKEIWKEIEGFDGRFSISNYGRVRQNNISYITKQNKLIKHEEKIIEPFIWQSKYLRVDLICNKKDNKHRLATYIHKLVAEYFIGERPEGYEIDHIDGNYLNNRVDNLQYVSHKDNMNNPITIERHKLYKPTQQTKELISQRTKEAMNNSIIKSKMSNNKGMHWHIVDGKRQWFN